MENLPENFAICIFAEEDALITPRRIYKILPDEKAEQSNYVRIIDDEGEDYLYPKSSFVFTPFPKEIEKALLAAV